MFTYPEKYTVQRNKEKTLPFDNRYCSHSQFEKNKIKEENERKKEIQLQIQVSKTRALQRKDTHVLNLVYTMEREQASDLAATMAVSTTTTSITEQRKHSRATAFE